MIMFTKRGWSNDSHDPLYFHSKSREYAFLSNFYKSPIFEPKTKKVFPNVETYFQGYKYVNRPDADAILEYFSHLKEPQDAKKAGSRKQMPMTKEEEKEWILGRRVTVMREALDLKFSQHPELRDHLLKTGDKVLIERVPRGDEFWGIRSSAGANVLGQLLMQVRQSYLPHTRA